MEKMFKDRKTGIKLCMLEDKKLCDNCLECNVCDINPKKICDSCAKCIDPGIDYNVIEIDEILIEKDLKKKLQLLDEKKSKPVKN